MKTYSVIAKPSEDWGRPMREGTINFSTNSKELYERVLDYISDCVDAISYRNSLKRISKVDGVDDEA